MKPLKNIYLHKRLILVTSLLVLSACKPDSIDIDIYTSDIDAASAGEVIEVPVKVSFSLMSDDEENILPKAIDASKNYLSEDTKFSQSKGTFGETLVVETTIPFGKMDVINNYLIDKNRVAVIVINDDGTRLELFKTKIIDELDKKLSNINMMMGVEFPAGKTTFEIISDTKDKRKYSATAVFISKKPYLNFNVELERRDTVEITFSGDDGSVYSEIAPVIFINK